MNKNTDECDLKDYALNLLEAGGILRDEIVIDVLNGVVNLRLTGSLLGKARRDLIHAFRSKRELSPLLNGFWCQPVQAFLVPRYLVNQCGEALVFFGEGECLWSWEQKAFEAWVARID